MLTNYIINSQKFVLFIDLLGLESQSHTILESIINPLSNGTLTEITEFDKVPELMEPTNVQLGALSKLTRKYKESEILQFISNLKRNKNVKQVFLWATPANLHDTKLFVLSFLQHMADLVITFKDKSNLNILSKGSTGLVTNKAYTYSVLDDSTINIKLKVSPNKNANETPAINPEDIGTFKIGNLNENELLAKKSLLLPYENKSGSGKKMEGTGGGTIIYEPDADDDFDEEDPDEDLYI